MAPVAVKLWGGVSTNDGTHPSALKELTFDLDRNSGVNAKGLPVCHPPRRYRVPGDLRACRSAIIGSGSAHFEFAFPEYPPIRAPSNLTLYNGGHVRGVMTVYAVAFVDVPVPSAIVIPVEVRRIHDGRYGLHAVARIPPIAGGNGSLLDFNLKIKRLFEYQEMQKSYAMARCPDRHLDAEIGALFKNEIESPGLPPITVIRGAVGFRCAPAD
jgi:hypothetical protein